MGQPIQIVHESRPPDQLAGCEKFRFLLSPKGWNHSATIQYSEVLRKLQKEGLGRILDITSPIPVVTFF